MIPAPSTMRSYLNIKSLLYATILLLLFRMSNASTILVRSTSIPHGKTSGDTLPAWKSRGFVQDLSPNPRVKDVSLNEGGLAAGMGRSTESLHGLRRDLDLSTINARYFRRRSLSDGEQSILQTRTNEMVNQKAQTKTGTGQAGATTRASEQRSQQRKRPARQLSVLSQKDLTPQVPSKRPRLDRLNDGEWKRSDSKASKSTDDVQPNVATESKLDEKAKSPLNLDRDVRDPGHSQNRNAAKEPARKLYLVPGAQFHSQTIPELQKTSRSRQNPAAGQYGDAHVTLTVRPKTEATKTKSQSMSIKERQDISQANAAVSTDQQRDQNALRSGIALPDHVPMSVSVHPRNRSGSREIAPVTERARSSGSFEAVSARQHSRNNPAQFPESVPFAERLNRLVVATQPQAQEDRFVVPPARFPNSVPEADKLNQLLDAGIANRMRHT